MLLLYATLPNNHTNRFNICSRSHELTQINTLQIFPLNRDCQKTVDSGTRPLAIPAFLYGFYRR